MTYKQQLADIINILNNIKTTASPPTKSTTVPAKTEENNEKKSLSSFLATNEIETILLNDIIPSVIDIALPGIPIDAIMETFKPITDIISAATKIYDVLTVSTAEQREKMETSLSVYENAKNTLSTISCELETQEQAINDLLTKDKLSYIEEGELAELQEITKELRIQRDLADREEERTQKEVAQDSSDLFQKQFGQYDVSQESIEDYQNDDKYLYLLDSDNNNISSMIADYKGLKKELDKAYKSGSEEDISEYESLIGDVEQDIFSAIQELENLKGNISDFYNTIKDTPYDKLAPDEKEIVDSYNEISNAIALICQQVDPDTWKSMQIEDIFNTPNIEKSKEELLQMAKAGALDENVIQSYYNLSKALAQNKISASEFCDELINISKQKEHNNANNFKDRYNSTLGDTKLQLDGYGHDERGFEVNNNNGNRLDAFWKENILTEDDLTLWQKVTAGIDNATVAMNAYAQAKGNAIPNNDFSTLPFYETWNALESNEHEDLNGMKENLLSLAESGYLTRDTFNETEGTDTFLSRLGIGPYDVEKIDTLIAKINQLKSSKDQLSSMENGISGLSENLSYKEENPGEAISPDVFSGMDSGLKEQTAEWEQYQSVLGDAGSSMEEVREATNKLASAYVNSNNFLANLTEANKDYYISQLDAMGVADSTEIVEETLTAQREISQNKAEALSLATEDLANVQSSYALNSADSINAAYEQSAAFVNQSNMTDYAKFALADLIAHQTIFSTNTLNTSDKIASLGALANAYLGAAAQASFLNKVQGGLNSNYRISPEAAWEQVKNEFASITSFQIKAPAASPKNRNTQGGTNKSSNKQPEKKEFKESFNWLERFIKRLQSSFDKWLAQAETALTGGFLNIYYRKAASLAKSQLSTYGNVYNKNMEKANAVGLDEKYAEKVRNGALDIDTIEDEDLAKKIKEYQNWYDKAQDSMDSFRETAKKLYNLPLDKAAKKVDLFSNAIDLLNKELDNKTNYKKKNQIIDKQTAKEKQTLKAYKEAETDTKKSFSSAKKKLLKNQNLDGDDGITAKERKIIQKSVRKNKEVNLSRFTENSAGYQAAVKYNEALKARKQAIDDRKSAEQDYKRWKVEASKLKFDNIAEHYDKKVQVFDYDVSTSNNKISETEAAGKKVNISDYKTQKRINQNILSQHLAEKADLEKSLASITEYTDEWYDAYDKIQQVNTAISECNQKTYELNNAINQLHFDMFDDISDSIRRIISEQEFLQGLFAHEKSTDTKTGKLTEAGLARLGSLSTSYYASKNNADRDKAQVDELRRMLNSKTLHSNTLGITFNSIDDLQKKLSETYTKWQDDIKQTYSLESALADIVKEKYQAELDKLQELINARKEAMNAEKDLHDYQRTISQKTKDIATVRKQIAAYSGDTSEEGRAKLQRLQKELTDKEDDLRETEYNRLISDQQAMLDKLYEQYRELTEKKMGDFRELVEEGHRMAQENAGIISSYLSNIATANDYKEENQNLLTGISSSISKNVENIIKAIADNKTNLSGTKDNSEGAKNNNTKKSTPKKNNKKNNNKNKKKSSNSKKNGSAKQEVILENSSLKRISSQKDILINSGFSQLESDIPVKDYRGSNSLTQASLEQESIIWDLTAPTLRITDVVPDLTATPERTNLNNIVNIDSITLPNVTNYNEFKERMFHDMQNNGNYIRFVNNASINRTDGAGRLTKNAQTL